jgi:hypothetical protein
MNQHSLRQIDCRRRFRGVLNRAKIHIWKSNSHLIITQQAVLMIFFPIRNTISYRLC